MMTEQLSRAEMELLAHLKWPDGLGFSAHEDDTGEDPRLLLIQRAEELVRQVQSERNRNLEPALSKLERELAKRKSIKHEL